MPEKGSLPLWPLILATLVKVFWKPLHALSLPLSPWPRPPARPCLSSFSTALFLFRFSSSLERVSFEWKEKHFVCPRALACLRAHRGYFGQSRQDVLRKHDVLNINEAEQSSIYFMASKLSMKLFALMQMKVTFLHTYKVKSLFKRSDILPSPGRIL